MSLTPRQRKHLKALAHALEPVVRIGRGRLGEAVVAETVRTIDAHELIKIRIDVDGSEDRRAIAESLSGSVDAELVATIGKIAILYKPRAEKPKIHLPES